MDGWNEAMQAIDERLEAEIDVAELARIARTSEYHFRRMFSTLAGLPLSEYIRRRRLTVAAAAVLAGRETLSDIAVRFGYGSADAFARAFAAVHGVGPDEARRTGAPLRSQSRLSFHLTVEGSSPMEYRVTPLPAFRIVGRSTRVPLVFEGPNTDIERFTRELGAEVRDRIAALGDSAGDGMPGGTLSVSDEFDESRAEGSMLRYTIGAATRAEASPPADLDAIEVAAGDWLVLSTEGRVPEALQQLWPLAYGEWLPANPYRLVPGPEILAVEPIGDGSTARAELWLPIEPEPAAGGATA